MNPSYAIVAAQSRNHVIGRGSDIPWQVKGEQALFKKITQGGCLVMGRKTFESIGRPLPGRLTLIVTRQQGYRHDGCEVFNSISAAMTFAASTDRPIFVVGGGELYGAMINDAQCVHLTTVEIEVSGDVYFPEFPRRQFDLIETEHFESNINYTYQRYVNRDQELLCHTKTV
ncbi:MAG: dihydrofolate reductase [Pseudomonadales bacterium]